MAAVVEDDLARPCVVVGDQRLGVVEQDLLGHGADIVYNTVGSPYFEAACKAMAGQGPADLYLHDRPCGALRHLRLLPRGRHRFVGIDTLALDSGECAAILDALKPGFESGKLRPFPVRDDHCFPLDQAATAYKAVLTGSSERVVLTP